ncbi:hypothetical protein AQUCO_00100658v1 [Aquilegia coerulea]|uniref:Uncharacterized protein n=1 Tax=Aquilegia coerulea TaxID=218851 RepID=A0A2G5FBE2_AQUCA|nr:hypothetical protein AQUCO_00100658v1 [Aquilegia coerulea]
MKIRSHIIPKHFSTFSIKGSFLNDPNSGINCILAMTSPNYQYYLFSYFKYPFLFLDAKFPSIVLSHYYTVATAIFYCWLLLA